MELPLRIFISAEKEFSLENSRKVKVSS